MPWWVGIIAACERCGARVKLEETDQRTIHQKYSQLPMVEFVCPTMGCYATIVQHKPGV